MVYADLRERYNDEEGPVEALVLHEVSDEGDGLDSFSQTHLISQDAIQVVVITRHQPLQTFNLSRKTQFGSAIINSLNSLMS